jgi:hypothetical protein
MWPHLWVSDVTLIFLLSHNPSNVLHPVCVGRCAGVTRVNCYPVSRNKTLVIAILLNSTATTTVHYYFSTRFMRYSIHRNLRSYSFASVFHLKLCKPWHNGPLLGDAIVINDSYPNYSYEVWHLVSTSSSTSGLTPNYSSSRSSLNLLIEPSPSTLIFR